MLNIALIGCGRIAKRHSELLGGGFISGARLSAVCDLNIDKAKKIGETFSVPYFVDMHQMIQSAPIDVVVILTESGNHASNVIELAKYKKVIIVEKPMALALEDADAMIDVCKREGVKLFVVKQNRFNLPIIKLKEALVGGRFGKISLGTIRVRWCRNQDYYDQGAWRGTWAMDGGVLTNQASHHIDLLEWMLGDVESVSALGATSLAKIEAEDTALAILRFKNGALGVVEATTAARPKDLEGSISVLGEAGTVEIGGFAANEIKCWSFTEPQDDDLDVVKNFSTNPPNVYGFGHQAYYEHIVRCLNEGEAALIDGLEGRKSLELIHAIYKSIETGEKVYLSSEPRFSKLGVGY
jgi:predicted dehydrogenase